MRIFYRQLFLLVALISFSLVTMAQMNISGQLNDIKSGNGLSGATIRNKTSGATAVSAKDGSFSIPAAPGDKMEVTMTGYNSYTMTMAKQIMVTIQMESSATTMTDIVMVGTRSSGRVKTETPVPVDIVNVDQLFGVTARTDITSILNYSAPSFNFNKQSGSDGADHIDLATLRGLGPDQTLVLVNGKRRHQTAFVAVFGTRGRGNSGTDLSAIPVNAIERVEILRDGAAAQYGSDAIAGVINLVLKKNTGVFSGNVGYSAYHDRKYNPYFKREYGQYVYSNGFDGNTFNFNGNYGVNIGKKGGFMNFTGNFISQAKTFRQALDTNPSSKDFMYTNIYRRAHGDGSLTAGGFFVNMEAPVNDNGTTFYAFGGFNKKVSDAYAFTRNWSARPDRFPTNSDGSLIYVPDIMRTTPDGDTFYNPRIRTEVRDFSLASGIRGKLKCGWNWDLSNSFGFNDFHYYGKQTFNASLGAGQTDFDDGGFNYLQNTVNLNFSRRLNEKWHLGAGSEFRYEKYKLYAGEAGSYRNYDASGVKAGGAQGFPGYQPGDAVKADRTVLGAYADVEWDATSRILLEGAARFEYYSDFGSTFRTKLAARIKAADNFNFRGSISSGFRAPSLQQINFSSTFTTVAAGEIAEVKIAPNYSPITKAAGIPALKQERSVNASLGFSWKPMPELTFTVDAYRVKIWDRVVLSGQFSAEDNTLDPELLQAMDDLNVSYAQFFANAANTTNSGLDIVMDYKRNLSNKRHFRALFAGNIQKMKIDKINVPGKLANTPEHAEIFFSDREQKFLLASAPNSKYAINLEYGWDKLSIGARVTYFGKVVLLGYGEDGLGIDPQVPSDADANVYVPDQFNYSGKWVTDLYLNYHLNKNLNLTLGADNIFNVHPDLGINPQARGWAFNNETGGPWDAVQMGGNGTRFFLRLGFNF